MRTGRNSLMIGAVGSRSTVAAAPGASPPGTRTPSLDAELNTVRAQLEDWVTCPSAKTPEGKAKIKEVTAKFDSIKAQIAKEAKATDATAVAATAAVPPRPGSQPNPAIGSNIDVYV
jgi:hypothetical protein